MANLNWEKRNRDDRLTFVPSPRSQPATQRQLAFIIDLVYQKGQPKLALPKTKRGASDLIERLLDLPDVNEREPVRLAPVETTDTMRSELLIELRENFPQLSPMTIGSLVQLFSQIDELGMAFTFDALMHERTPDDPDALILHVLARFLSEFSAITPDNAELVDSR